MFLAGPVALRLGQFVGPQKCPQAFGGRSFCPSENEIWRGDEVCVRFAPYRRINPQSINTADTQSCFVYRY